MMSTLVVMGRPGVGTLPLSALDEALRRGRGEAPVLPARAGPFRDSVPAAVVFDPSGMFLVAGLQGPRLVAPSGWKFNGRSACRNSRQSFAIL